MNILFVYSVDDILLPDKPFQTVGEIPFGISYISALLKKHGHRTKAIVLNSALFEKNKNLIDAYSKSFYPKLICFTAVTTRYPFIKDVAKYIKARYPDIYLMIGGPHASLNPEEVLSDGFDALCIGEGEYPVLELVSQLEKGAIPSKIPNLWIKHISGVEKNPTRPFLQDIDSLPFPDREMWLEWADEREWSMSRYSVLLGRGCPFRCSYCCNHAFAKLAPGQYVRHRSPDNIAEEIRNIIATSPSAKVIYLEVETIAANIEWALALCSKLEDLKMTTGSRVAFGANLRVVPGADYERLFIAFKRSGFSFINIGVESGCERVRRDILRRHYSNQDIIKAVAAAKKQGLKVCFFNLIGIPGEAVSDFKETIELNRACLPNWHFNSIFFPYPGTDLHSLCKEKGLLDGPLDTQLERRNPALNLPGFSKKDILKSYIWFDYHAFKGRRPIYKVLGRVFAAWLRTTYYPRLFYRVATRSFILKRLRENMKTY